jgi:hypothetical protein
MRIYDYSTSNQLKHVKVKAHEYDMADNLKGCCLPLWRYFERKQ